MRYYDRKGRPISAAQWSALMDTSPDGYAWLAKTRVGPYEVSTVWLGIDMTFGGGAPIIFETMIFGPEDRTSGWQARCATEEQAHVVHAGAVELAQAWLEHDRSVM